MKITSVFFLTVFTLNVYSSNSRTLSYFDVKYPAPVKYVKIKNNKMAYVDVGRGTKTIVFIHGIASALFSFQILIKKLSRKYRVIAMDLLGNGRSDRPDISYSISSRARSVFTLLKKLNVKKGVIVGHSSGGAIATYFAIKYPKLVEKLILFAPAFLMKERKELVAYFLTRVDAWVQRIFCNDGGWLRQLVYKWNSDWDRFSEVLKRLKAHPSNKTLRRAVKRTIISALKTSTYIYDNIKSIHVPVLVLLGKHDSVVPGALMPLVDFVQRLKGRFRNIKIIVYERCGHMIPWERPSKIKNDIIQFVGN